MRQTCKLCGKKMIVGVYRHDTVGNEHPVCIGCSKKISDSPVPYLTYNATTDTLSLTTDTDLRKKCAVCGHIFRYTAKDFENFKNLAKKANNAQMVNAVAGSLLTTADEMTANMKLENGKIDIFKCPLCGSPELQILSKEEYQKELQAKEALIPAPAVSAADELKKFKELLDSGIITQEEFDAKKKQLLGL